MPRLLSPDYGLFVFADENPGAEGGQISGRESGYLWPNGATPHSTAEFEIVGALLGICFANGITLGKDIAPLSPLLFAQMTAGWLGTDDWSVEMLMRHLEPTFPALVSGLRVLLKWDEAQNEGMKVEDVFCRTFEITVYDPLKTTYRRYSGLKSLGLELPSSSSEFDDEDSLSLGNIPTGVEHANGYTTIPLIDNGSAIEVTSSNRRAYIRRYLQFLGDKYVRELVSALRSGFQQAADGIVYRMCQASELELLICGDDAPINIDELERVATYEEYDADHPVVRMFWRVVRSLTPRQHRKLLQFVMASDRLPLGGIDSLVFVIQRNGPDSDRLPTSLTCFSRLLLPAYASEQKMRRLLVTAIENAHGFGLV
ncbi:hypothetical protein EV182_003793 [Spiromyces aspiralis]|uniref:Uncharacterized protein n=1 Tax=Spiromyces aspiralis TaxID=68401 RepID=A0ACC1HCJ0_9FUNG|nr:hypothetical protein EV182_003793 [Spiromyces aspiralis]